MKWLHGRIVRRVCDWSQEAVPVRIAGPSLRIDVTDRSPRVMLETTTSRSLTVKQKAVLVAPPVLVVTMYIAFQQLTAHLGFPLGYLVAFSLYWVVWCLALPSAVLGPRRVVALFQPGDSRFAQSVSEFRRSFGGHRVSSVIRVSATHLGGEHLDRPCVGRGRSDHRTH